MLASIRSLKWQFASALPGFLLIVTVLVFDWWPATRDLPSYFLPLRVRTAAILRGEHSPFWNQSTGAGEPYFANPQTGLLYPVTWLALIFKPQTAIGMEVGLHMMLYGFGAALLAQRLGARGWTEVAAGWGTVLAGPSMDAAGVLNNLNTLTWIPFLWWAAFNRSFAGTAIFFALCYVAAEPQLAAIAAAIALILFPNRRTFFALLLGTGLIAVHLFPFVSWILNGDRQVVTDVYQTASGAVTAAETPSLLIPGYQLGARTDRYVTHLTFPAWSLLLSIAAFGAGDKNQKKLLLAGWILIAVSVLASSEPGGRIWESITGGTVRYPARLLFLSVPAIIPLAASFVSKKSFRPIWAITAMALLILTGLFVGKKLDASLQAIAAAAVFGGVASGISAAVASLALLPLHWEALNFQPSIAARPVPCLAEQRSGRLYSLEPSIQQYQWVQEDPGRRLAALGYGYTPLLDSRQTVRTFSPLQSRYLTEHFQQADRGPAGRWWLNGLGARVIAAHRRVDAFPLVCSQNDLYVYSNPQAWPIYFVARAAPRPGNVPQLHGAVKQKISTDARYEWSLQIGKGGGFFVWLQTPDPGWKFRLNGNKVEGERAAGIIQKIRVSEGNHSLEAVYRAPGLYIGATVSFLCLLLLIGFRVRR